MKQMPTKIRAVERSSRFAVLNRCQERQDQTLFLTEEISKIINKKIIILRKIMISSLSIILWMLDVGCCC
jgi:hypothetical protein